MTLENIKRLMDELNFPVFNEWGYELMLKFYEQAQGEAYEKAAQVCEEAYRYRGDYFAEKIRKLKEESCKS